MAKFALALADRDEDGNEQVLHHEAGVGTRRYERLLGGGLGVGLSRNVRACYRPPGLDEWIAAGKPVVEIPDRLAPDPSLRRSLAFCELSG